jgi:hypothetical protein
MSDGGGMGLNSKKELVAPMAPWMTESHYGSQSSPRILTLPKKDDEKILPQSVIQSTNPTIATEAATPQEALTADQAMIDKIPGPNALPSLDSVDSDTTSLQSRRLEDAKVATSDAITTSEDSSNIPFSETVSNSEAEALENSLRTVHHPLQNAPKLMEEEQTNERRATTPRDGQDDDLNARKTEHNTYQNVPKNNNTNNTEEVPNLRRKTRVSATMNNNANPTRDGADVVANRAPVRNGMKRRTESRQTPPERTHQPWLDDDNDDNDSDNTLSPRLGPVDIMEHRKLTLLPKNMQSIRQQEADLLTTTIV